MTDAVTKLIEALAVAPWALVACVGIGGLVYIVYGLSKNTKITEAIGKRIEAQPAEKLQQIHEVVSTIAERQLDIHSRVKSLEARVKIVELDINALGCSNAPHCNNRSEP